MFYMLRRDCYIREIGDYGYIKSSGLFNDLVFDKSGNNFLKHLVRKSKSLDVLSEEISKEFTDVSDKDIINDVEEFFEILVEDGYAVKGKDYEDCIKNNIGFDYSNIKQITIEENYTPKNIRSENDTQDVLDNYFKTHPYLSNFQIELTSKCNERCIHCYIPHKYKIDNIDCNLYYSVLDQLKEMGALGLTLSGGEPMVHPNFKEFLKAAKERDFYVHVLTNLTLLDDEIIEIMKSGNVCGVQVSLYSMSPEHHDAITTIKGSFEKTKNAILKLIENNIPVQISCPVMKVNKDDVCEVIKWGHEHKIRVLTDYAIMAEYNHDTGNLVNRLDPEECRKVIEDIIEYDEGYKEQINELINNENFEKYLNESPKINPDDAFCGAGINTACMVSNGSVYPCPGWQGYICGSLKEQTLEEIWNKSTLFLYLRGLKQTAIQKCFECKNRKFCSPCLCRFANESKTGNPLEVATHFCDVTEINKQVVTEYLLQKKLNEKK